MKQGFLSQYFDGIAAKRLSAVEVDSIVSHQHEMNGIVEMKKIFGEEKNKFPATFIYLNDIEDSVIEKEVFLTWYDARENHKTRTEYRLYFPSNLVTERFEVGDLIILGRRSDNSVMLICAKQGSTIENQLIWLFGLSVFGGSFEIKEVLKNDTQLNFASKKIIEDLGIDIKETADNLLEEMLNRFKGVFPETKIFSDYARNTYGEVDLSVDPDKILLAWIEHEEKLFRTLENHIVSNRLRQGFGKNNDNVDEFVSFSLSVQNRRKSRMGHALENHIEFIFNEFKIPHSKGRITENKKKPDFIFPDIKNYNDPKFPTKKLIMLASKSTCKDRWRQVLSEADRIKSKHLLTLEPGITIDQTNEMRTSKLQLVIPKEIHVTYSAVQQKWLMDFKGFIDFVRKTV